MHTVVETPIFTRRADALLSREERDALIARLAAEPTAGVLIPGLGGVRKLRFAAPGRGKSGGHRVIYFFGGADMPVYALLIYGKGEQADLTPDQRKAMAALAEELKAAHRRPARRATRG